MKKFKTAALHTESTFFLKIVGMHIWKGAEFGLTKSSSFCHVLTPGLRVKPACSGKWKSFARNVNKKHHLFFSLFACNFYQYELDSMKQIQEGNEEEEDKEERARTREERREEEGVLVFKYCLSVMEFKNWTVFAMPLAQTEPGTPDLPLPFTWYPSCTNMETFLLSQDVSCSFHRNHLLEKMEK